MRKDRDESSRDWTGVVLRDGLVVAAASAVAAFVAVWAGAEGPLRPLAALLAAGILAAVGGTGAGAVSWLLRTGQRVGGTALAFALLPVFLAVGMSLPILLASADGARASVAPAGLAPPGRTAAGATATATPTATAAPIVLTLLPPWAALETDATDGIPELRHPTLGFRVRHPGPTFQPVDDLPADVREMNQSRIAGFWFWSDARSGALVQLTATSEIREETDVRTFLGSFGAAWTDADGPQAPPEEAVRWEGDHGEARLEAASPLGETLSVRCLRERLPDGRSTPFVCVAARNLDRAATAELLESLRVR